MNLAGRCIFILCAVSLAAPHPPLQNITITVPQGTSNHSDPHLLCTPADGYHVVLFIFANYAAHVATIVTLPGETLGSMFLTMLFALIYPMTGIQKCIRPLGKHTLLRRDQSPLNNALRAGALCEVVRTPSWKPAPGHKICNAKVTDLPTPQEIRGPNANSLTEIELQPIGNQVVGPVRQSLVRDSIPDYDECSAREETRNAETNSSTEQSVAIEPHSNQDRPTTFDERPQFAYSIDKVEIFSPAKNTFQFQGRAIHGRCSIPPGYALSIIPANATVCPISAISGLAHSDLSSSYNILGILAAIFQLFSGTFALYRTKGDQIERYGFASFGLTVTPYVVMSFINLLTLAVTPSYSKLYLVRASIMEEARLRGAFFEGEVGQITETIAPIRDERSIRFISWISQLFGTHFPREYGQQVSDKSITTSGDIEFRGYEANVAKFTSVGPERQAIWHLNINGPTEIRQKRTARSYRSRLVEIPASPVIRPAYFLRYGETYLFVFLSMFINSFSLILIGCLSNFKSVEGLRTWKEIVMLIWLLLSFFHSASFIIVWELELPYTLSERSLYGYSRLRLVLFLICLYLLAGAFFTVRELIYVIQDLLEYGSCIRLF